MARTQAQDYEEKRLAIETHAARLFAGQGFHGTAISDIARACGMSKPSLYHYFASKEEILFAVMDDHVTLLLAISEEVKRAPALPPVEKLRTLCHRFMAAYVDAAARHVVLLNEINALPPAHQKTVRDRQNAVVANIVEIIEEINPELGKRRDLRKPVAMIFMGMINWTYTWFDPNGPVSSQAFADLVTDIFVGGLDGQAEASLTALGSPRRSLK